MLTVGLTFLSGTGEKLSFLNSSLILSAVTAPSSFVVIDEMIVNSSPPFFYGGCRSMFIIYL
jgi:hypothetical protein